MTREEAIDNVATATGTPYDEVKRAFDNLCQDKENDEYFVSRIKAIAKSTPRQDSESCAKVGKLRRKRK